MRLLVALLGWLPLAAQPVRVSVFGLFRPQRLVVKPAQGSVILVETDQARFVLEGSRAAGLRLAGAEIDCFAGGRLASTRRVRVTARGGGAAAFELQAPGKIQRRYQGTLEVLPREGVLLALVGMELDEAVAAAVAAESPPGALAEALKAQAVVTRSYYAAARGRHAGFDFCDTTHCQFVREPAAPGSPFRAAAESTAGLVVDYQGAVVAALYSASCGGRTRTAEETGMAAGAYPYFAAECRACREAAEPWERRLEGEWAALILSRPNAESTRLAIGRKLGWKAIPGNHYEARREGAAAVVSGRGAGHGVGLCQLGAAGLARGGADFRAILNHYLPGTSLRVQPAMRP